MNCPVRSGRRLYLSGQVAGCVSVYSGRRVRPVTSQAPGAGPAVAGAGAGAPRRRQYLSARVWPSGSALHGLLWAAEGPGALHPGRAAQAAVSGGWQTVRAARRPPPPLGDL